LDSNVFGVNVLKILIAFLKGCLGSHMHKAFLVGSDGFLLLEDDILQVCSHGELLRQALFDHRKPTSRLRSVEKLNFPWALVVVELGFCCHGFLILLSAVPSNADGEAF
jgi:hypothetical protein